MSFVSLPIQINAEALIEEAYAVMEANFPGWEPNPANAETILIRAMVYALVIPLAQLSSDVSEEIFARYGEQIVNTPPHVATPAAGMVKITVRDEAGYKIPAGTQIDLERTGSEQVGFRTAAPVEVEAGQTSVTDVPIEAIEAGSAGNNLSGAATLVDALGEIEAVELEGETGGGSDAEESIAYLNRLAETMETLAPRPIVARDVAILARSVSGVARAAVRDNYNLETNETGQEKVTTVGIVGPDGGTVALSVKEAVEALLEEKRELNFRFFVANPSYTVLYIEAELVPAKGYVQAEAVAGAEAQLDELLDPARWGVPPGVNSASAL